MTLTTQNRESLRIAALQYRIQQAEAKIAELDSRINRLKNARKGTASELGTVTECNAATLHAAGASYAKLARAAGVCEKTVERWVQKSEKAEA